MGAYYEVGVLTPAAGAGAPYLQIRTAGPRLRVREIHLVQTQATVSPVGLVRSATLGTASASTLFAAHDTSEAAGVTLVETAWTSAPTIAGTPVYLRRANIAATNGNGVTWSFPDPILIGPTAGLLLWNWGSAGGGILAVNVIAEE